MLERDVVCRKLIDNVRRVSKEYQTEILKWENIVLAEIKGKEYFLPAYIPYIGSQYFADASSRILVYALSQNLKKDNEWTKDWALNWHESEDEKALNRQNIAYANKHGQAAMRPFNTGHIPVLCALLRFIVNQNSSVNSSSIYDEIVATNLSKFSFRKNDKTKDSIECLKKCWEWFSIEEIKLLNPKFILCAGNSVYNIVIEGLKQNRFENNNFPKVLKVSFPSLRVINRFFKKELRPEHLKYDSLISLLCEKDRDSLSRIIKRDSYYFAEMYKRMWDQLVH